MTDTHCHLGSGRFGDDEVAEVVARARGAGVSRMVTLGTGEDDWGRNVAIAEEFEEVFACVGVHPCDVQENRDDFEAVLRPLLDHEKVVAVGETGLDYFHSAPEGWSEEDYHARQRDFLRRHFVLAREAGLNVVIHTRDRTGTGSFDDALAIYEEFREEVRAVFHCFPGPYAQAAKVLALGGLVSFTGIVTFKNAREVVDAARKVPLDRLMVETDAPYLAPEPNRGKRCEPAFVMDTARRVAEERGLELAELVEVMEKTAEAFFRF
ncbi:MAG: TatD family hydrolase [Verrucomicrobiota bacterium]